MVTSIFEKTSNKKKLNFTLVRYVRRNEVSVIGVDNDLDGVFYLPLTKEEVIELADALKEVAEEL